MYVRRSRTTLALICLIALCVIGFVPQASARPGGISGYSGMNGSTCTSCHSSAGTHTSTISGPTTVTSGSTSTYTFTSAGAPLGGFDVAVSGGTLIAGSGSRLLNNEVVHSAALSTSPLSWTFQWTAPTVTAATSITMSGAGIAGGYDGTTGSTRITINVQPAASAPLISSHPSSITVNAGQTAAFSVTASGSAPLSYQWQKNGANISGATAASYTTPATISADNGATFKVVVSNSAGSVTSNSATLTVNTPATAPSITTQPANQTVTAGQTASFSVAASGTAPLSYQWRKNGAAIAGATSASYTTPATTSADSGAMFSVVVTNAAGSATSNNASLTVNPAPVAPSITTQPANQTVTAGQTASFSVAASGTAPMSYQWRKNGAAIAGATSASYTTPATASADNGAMFSVVVTNAAGSATSNNASLTVNAAPVAPSITSQPANQTVTAGQTASFSVAASGTAPMSYQWRKNGAAIAGATSASYTTPATTSADNGAAFSVVVTNAAGSATSNNASLTVNAAPVAPSITSQPASQTVTAGQTASFSVAASGTAPMSYQWRKNGTAIAGATAASYTTPATTSADSGALFSVVVTNAAGSATSSNAMLTVNAAPVAPSITSQPANQTVNAGQTASFSVAASGTAPMSYQWRKNGTAIAGATAASYTTPATTSADSGAAFSVVVTNAAGSATSSNATLTVNSAPVAPSITSQPASKTVTAGQTASFSVAASGTAPMSYQWRKNGAAITGATAASYTTPATTSADNGALFSVVVTNAAGSATSNNATLTVNPVTPPPPSTGSLAVWPSRLVFFTERGGRPAPKTISVNSTGSPLSFTVGYFGGTWLSASPSGGTTPAKISVTAFPAGLPAGTYSGTVKITSGTSSKYIPVVLVVARGDDDDDDDRESSDGERSSLSLQPFSFDPKGDDSAMAGLVEKQGLVLAKSSSAPRTAIAGAALAGAAGRQVRELGFDLLAGSNCTATAPQIVVITADDVTHTAGCASGSSKALASGWKRVRFSQQQLKPAVEPGSQIKAMALVMDQTSDKGIAVLNNVDLNGRLIATR